MKQLILIVLLCVCTTAAAVVETFEFKDEVTRQRYLKFVEELRCPKCQNQNLAGSDAPIAKDLRNVLYNQLQAGRSDDEIVDFMVSRYGEYVLYRPPLEAKTVVLWTAPGILLAVALVLLWRHRRELAAHQQQGPLSDQEKARLRELLAEGDRD